jgi:hypothetical protein
MGDFLTKMNMAAVSNSPKKILKSLWQFENFRRKRGFCSESSSTKTVIRRSCSSGSISQRSEESSSGSSLEESVLSLEVFVKLEERFFHEGKKLNEIEQIHNKLVFDSVNEILDTFRPFETSGPTPPWKSFSKHIHFKKASRSNFSEIWNQVESIILSWGKIDARLIEETLKLKGGPSDSLCPDFEQKKETNLTFLINKEVIFSEAYFK